MKKFLKRFIKLSWHGIPIGIIASILICTTVIAATYIAVTQSVTQQIVEPSVPPDYGSISAEDIDLSNVELNSSFNQTFDNAVIVELGPDGGNRALKMVCAPDLKYDSFDVTITLTDKPAGSEVGLYGYGISGGGEISVDLDLVGTYTFDQTVSGKAGGNKGSAESIITFTLETSTTPP